VAVMVRERLQTRIVALDPLRMLAAVWVALHHLAFCSWADPGSEGARYGIVFPDFRSLRAMTEFGWIGVEIFFVISGYVIAYSSIGATPVAFLRNRVLRLVPTIWICATLAAVSWVGWGMPPAEAAQNYARTVTLFPFGKQIASAYWTLTVEIAYYLTIALLLWSSGARHLERFTLALGGVSATLWVAYVASISFADSIPRLTNILSRLTHGPIGERLLLQHGCFFALGMLIWRITAVGLKARDALVLPLFLIACVLQIKVRNDHLGAMLKQTLPLAPALITWLSFLAVLALSIFFNRKLSSALSSRTRRVLLTLGIISYPFYLLHEAIGFTVIGLWGDPNASIPLVLALAISVTALVAFVIATYVEPPLRAWLERPWQRHSRPAVAANNELPVDGS
jgi:exopolysaccharide production protein ExoZ